MQEREENPVYIEVESLIKLLRSQGHQRLSDILCHRMYDVAWTTGSELMDELTTVLDEAVADASCGFDEVTLDKIAFVRHLVRNDTKERMYGRRKRRS